MSGTVVHSHKRDKLSPQVQGREYEEDFCSRYGFNLHPNSGSGAFIKMDASGYGLYLSLKYTTKKSFSLKSSDLKEVEEAVRAPGGVGLDYVPALITGLEGKDYITMEFSDFQRILEEQKESPRNREPSKTAIKESKSKVPELFRDS